MDVTGDLRRICDVCGAEYGEHRASDDACPPDPLPDDEEQTIDHLSEWKDTKFKPKEGA